MREVMHIVINSLSSIIGAFIFVILAFNLFEQENKLSIWWCLIAGGMGAFCLWKISDVILQKLMPIRDNNHVKILFRFYSNVLEEITVETMWATIIDKKKGLYKLDNIPFYAPNVASDDILFAEYDDQEKMLTFRHTAEYSGNSTIQVVLLDKNTDITVIRDLFKNLGCVSEKANEGYFSMEVPSTIDYRKIKQKLEELESQEIISYAESCLSEGHRH